MRDQFKIRNISRRALGYGMPGRSVDGNDVIAVYQEVRSAVNTARSGKGPSLIEAKTYRWRGHIEGDSQVYQPKEEIALWMRRCPIKRLKKRLKQQGLLTEEEFTLMDKNSKGKVEAAVEFADRSPWPSPEEALEDVLA